MFVILLPNVLYFSKTKKRKKKTLQIEKHIKRERNEKQMTESEMVSINLLHFFLLLKIIGLTLEKYQIST